MKVTNEVIRKKIDDAIDFAFLNPEFDSNTLMRMLDDKYFREGFVVGFVDGLKLFSDISPLVENPTPQEQREDKLKSKIPPKNADLLIDLAKQVKEKARLRIPNELLFKFKLPQVKEDKSLGTEKGESKKKKARVTM